MSKLFYQMPVNKKKLGELVKCNVVIYREIKKDGIATNIKPFLSNILEELLQVDKLVGSLEEK